MKKRLVYAASFLIVLYGCAASRHNGAALDRNAPAEGPKAPAAPQTLAGPALQKETLSMILFTDDALSHGIRCADRRITKKEVLGQTPADEGAPGSWTERWTLDRCGTALRYRVFYTSGKNGTAYFTVKKEK